MGKVCPGSIVTQKSQGVNRAGYLSHNGPSDMVVLAVLFPRWTETEPRGHHTLMPLMVSDHEQSYLTQKQRVAILQGLEVLCQKSAVLIDGHMILALW